MIRIVGLFLIGFGVFYLLSGGYIDFKAIDFSQINTNTLVAILIGIGVLLFFFGNGRGRGGRGRGR
jgi:uncharacterized membrane protein (DUF441 family)